MKAAPPRVAILVLAGIAMALQAPAALAHPGHTLPVDELTRNAGMIVEGRVSAVDAAWNTQRTQIFTTVTVQVERYHKGGGPSQLTFRLLGGIVGDQTLAILGQAAFGRGEQVFLFMDPRWQDGVYPVVGGEHGKFTVMTDRARGREYLFNRDADVTKSDALGLIRRLNAGSAR
jgi:hypothetical protein